MRFFQIHVERCWRLNADFVTIGARSIFQSEFPISVVVKSVEHYPLLVIVTPGKQTMRCSSLEIALGQAGIYNINFLSGHNFAYLACLFPKSIICGCKHV
jgi:hypothetical protein